MAPADHYSLYSNRSSRRKRSEADKVKEKNKEEKRLMGKSERSSAYANRIFYNFPAVLVARENAYPTRFGCLQSAIWI
jgi:hypothetical protein